MSVKIVCDGACGQVLNPELHQVAIEGERADGFRGGGLPGDAGRA